MVPGRRRGRILASSHMIEARRTSLRASRYDIAVDGAGVATWSGSAWRPGGTMERDGATRCGATCGGAWSRWLTGAARGSRRRITSAAGAGPSRPTGSPTGSGGCHRGVRRRRHTAGIRVGSVRRASVWRGDAVADLPGLPLAVAVFVLAWFSRSGTRTQWPRAEAVMAGGWRARTSVGHPPFTRDGQSAHRGVLDAPGRPAAARCPGATATHPDRHPARDGGSASGLAGDRQRPRGPHLRRAAGGRRRRGDRAERAGHRPQ